MGIPAKKNTSSEIESLVATLAGRQQEQAFAETDLYTRSKSEADIPRFLAITVDVDIE